ncbi:hypothetical protein GCM10025867_21050 [Frondihabitans sucicola]|uniref:PDZ domain-containing protein n=1 Tax=Frondihabitans sucicola TaxID=1268041 RepID=A0ABM8GNP6_9MICO|nr:trypsin-like peptidase domain-containing protein [Frondihabitans sucicola]BDZ49864.1 hypothetical protein GCM10025867_21050 [Frondihabitans sucicola]
MTETPGRDVNPDDVNPDDANPEGVDADGVKPADETSGDGSRVDEPRSDEPRQGAVHGDWQAPHASARQTGKQPAAEPAAEQPPAGPSAEHSSVEPTVDQPASAEHETAEYPSDSQPTQEYPSDSQPTQEYPSEAPRGSDAASSGWGVPPVGAPPLPGEAPTPLADAHSGDVPPTDAASHSGLHRAPASLDHAAYAGANSAAFGSLGRPDSGDAASATPEGTGFTGGPSGYSYDSSNAAAAGGWSAPVAPRPRKRGLGALVAVAVVAAVIGALVATGGYALLGSRPSTAEGGTPSNLTIGHYDDATVVTAVAAKATPSVVTIDVASGTSEGTGSGVVLTSDGYIVTNTHVVTLDGASATGTVRVTTSSGRIYAGKIIGTDPLVDLAVIKIDATGMTPIEFANSSKLNVGDTAVAIGAPLGLSNTVTDGIVSTLDRSISVASSAAPSTGGDSSDSQDNNGQGPFSFDNGSGPSSGTSNLISLPVIQTDASINPGNSGGALLDSKGKLIGINVAIASASASSDSGAQSGSIGVGFSIPANLVKRVANDIKDTGSATHGLLGASVGDATSDTTASHTGALIKSLTSSGAAEKAGLRAGDVVTQFDGNSVTGATDLTAQVRTLAGGDTGSLTYIRDGNTKTTTVTLGTLKG